MLSKANLREREKSHFPPCFPISSSAFSSEKGRSKVKAFCRVSPRGKHFRIVVAGQPPLHLQPLYAVGELHAYSSPARSLYQESGSAGCEVGDRRLSLTSCDGGRAESINLKEAKQETFPPLGPTSFPSNLLFPSSPSLVIIN